jgi:predicted TIM-barrel fold metal-dependent hydrolase
MPGALQLCVEFGVVWGLICWGLYPYALVHFMEGDVDVIDAHQHFFDSSHTYAFPEGAEIDTKYGFEDFTKDSSNLNVVKSIMVESSWGENAPNEAKFAASIAKNPSNKGGFPHAFVAAIDFSSSDVAATIETYKANDLVTGVRQYLNYAEGKKFNAAKDYLADDTWRENVALLNGTDLLFELHIYPEQLQAAATLAKANKDITFVLDHVGCPDMKEASMASWKEGMRTLAENKNVAVKVSGLMNPLYSSAKTLEDAKPWMKAAIDIFSSKRAIFGSNYPVDKASSITYKELVGGFASVLQEELMMMKSTRKAIMHDNAVKYYNLAAAAVKKEGGFNPFKKLRKNVRSVKRFIGIPVFGDDDDL